MSIADESEEKECARCGAVVTRRKLCGDCRNDDIDTYAEAKMQDAFEGSNKHDWTTMRARWNSGGTLAVLSTLVCAAYGAKRKRGVMTVKQLRDWLIKQDETAVISVSTDHDGDFYAGFLLRATSEVNTNPFADEPQS